MNKKSIQSCSADILTQHIMDPATISTQLDQFFVNFLNPDELSQFDMNKRSGAGADEILKELLKLRLNQISIGTNELTMEVDTAFNTDTFYNYQKRSRNDVLRMTTWLSKQIDTILNSSQSLDKEFENGIFIIDDTPYKRPYSKKTELASSQFDHSTGDHFTGFRNNQLGYYRNGNYIPINAVPVSTTEPDKPVKPAQETKCPVGQEKRELTQTKMTEVSLYQLDLALKAGFKGNHCLFDTWYANHKIFSELLDRNIYGIGMVKNSPKLKFAIDGEKLSTGEIFTRNKNNLMQLLHEDFYFSVVVEAEYEGRCFPVKLHFFTAESNKRDFICIATTDLSLSSKTIKILYKVRWSTEEFFADTKDVKSINSTNQCQC